VISVAYPPPPDSGRKFVILMGLLEFSGAKIIIQKNLDCRVVTTMDLSQPTDDRSRKAADRER